MALKQRFWRILYEHRGRYISIFLLLFLGGLFFVAAFNIGTNLERLTAGFAAQNLQEDLSFSADRPIENPAQLEAATGAVIDSYQYFDTAQSEEAPLRLLTPCDKINLPAVKSGRMAEGPGEILLDPYFCTLHDIAEGDVLNLGGDPYTVVGTFAVPHYVYALKNINDVLPQSGFGIGLVSPAALEGQDGAVTVYAARFSDRTNINAQAAALYGLLEEEGYSISDWADASANKRIQMPWASITGVKTMSVPIPVGMYLLSCVMIAVVMRRMVKSDCVVIGTLYAQGYRLAELERHYMRIPITLAISGSLFGAVMALPLVAPMVRGFIGTYYNIPDTGISLSVLSILLAVGIPLAFLWAACRLAIRSELKRTPGELMRGEAVGIKVNFLERHLRLEHLPFTLKFQLREQIRSLPRLLFMLFGVSIASMLLLFGFTINHSMNVLFDSSVDDMYAFRYEYTFKQTQTEAPPEGAEPFNAMRCYPEGRENAEFYVMGVVPQSSALRFLDRGESYTPSGDVKMSYPLANRLGLKIGDDFTFVEKRSGKTYTLKVQGIVQMYSGQFVYLPLDQFNAITEEAPGSYSGLFSDQMLPLSDTVLAGVKDLQETADSMTDLAGPMIAAVVVITAVSVLMGVLILYLVTSLMIDESRTTISLLKVFGYRQREVRRLVLSSGTVVVILGFLLGIPLMLLSANAMYGYLGNIINMVLPMILSPLYVFISFLLILLVYELTKLLCGKKLAQVSMNEALKGAE